MNTEHTVAIVGRPNVGKSALFNALAGRDISLVFDRPGTTRDRLVTSAKWGPHRINLIDTGGIGAEDREGFQDAIEHEVQLALAAATEIIFVVDAREGITPLDQIVARQLRKSHCPVFVAANKVDSDKQANLDAEFSRLGFAGVFPTSAAHRRGLDDLREAVSATWTESTAEEEAGEQKLVRPTRLAIVGRPNAGKSSLFNRLVERERAIVTEAPGTTRDLVTELVSIAGIPVELIDTAGLRDAADEAERLGIAKSHQAMADADLVLLVLDAPAIASAGQVPPEDRAVLARQSESGALNLILAANKIDMFHSQLQIHNLVANTLQIQLQTGAPSSPRRGTDNGRRTTDPSNPASEHEARASNRIDPVPTSALTGEGIPELRAAIVAAVAGGEGGLREAGMLTNLRQHQAVERALRGLDAAQSAVAVSIPHEMLLLDLYEALRGLDSLTGATTTEDVLRLIFSSFCIGK